MTDSTVVARPTRDCARRLEIRYRLPAPATESLLERFPADGLKVTRFSEKVPGSLDHFQARLGPCVTVRGALGGLEVSARFDHPADDTRNLLVAGFHRALERWGLGRVVFETELEAC